MGIFELMDKINYLNQLIESEKTGSPEYLSQRLCISRASLYRLIEELKSCGAPIKYSRKRGGFYYSKKFKLVCQYSFNIIEDEDILEKINGGSKLFFPISKMRRKGDYFANEYSKRM